MMKRILKMFQPLWLLSYSACAHNSGSSPNSNSDTSKEDGVVKLDADYENWMVDHPSALEDFDQMMNITMGKRIVVFLDYDGTLSPIVNDPQKAFMSDSMRSAVSEVARLYPTAIISGRSRDKVYDFVKLDDVYYAGSHGMDIIAPPRKQDLLDGYQRGNEAMIFQPAREFLPEIIQIFKELEEATKDIEGVIMEDNRFCLSVHFRRAHEQDYAKIEERVNLVIANHPRFHLTRGRKVLEIRPLIKWNKGNALDYLLETLGFAELTDVHPIYIGDDRTDEDAFEVLERRRQGFSIIVSTKAKDTMASYSLRDPSEVLLYLVRLSRWKRNSSSS
ncbi:hypothetical protein V2J09_001854 [Rumex salicifolius]